jgi:hypothetical protein
MPGRSFFSFHRTMSRIASRDSGRVSKSIARIRAQESGKTTLAFESRPPETFRATSTASANASRVKSGVPEGPEPSELGGYTKFRDSANPGEGSRRTLAQVTPSASRQKTCGGTTGGRRESRISRRT